jgi:hypothetical protein
MWQALFHYDNIAMGSAPGLSVLYIHYVFENSVFYNIMFVYDGNRTSLKSCKYYGLNMPQ